MPPKKSRGGGGPRTRSGKSPRVASSSQPDTPSGAINAEKVANMIARQVAAAIPTIIAQINDRNLNNVPPLVENRGRTNNDNRGGGEGSGDKSSECSYKTFLACRPKDFHGTEGTIQTLRWMDEMETILDISKCAENDKVRFVSHSFKSEALELWNTIIQPMGRNEANGMSWNEFVKELISKYCPLNEMEKLQTKFLSLSMVGKDVVGYTQRFNALARLLPNLVTPESQKVGRYIWGLDARVRSYVKTSQPATTKSAIELAAIVTDDRVRAGDFDQDDKNGKRKIVDDSKQMVYAADEPERMKDRKDQRKENPEVRTKVYQGTHPLCVKCNLHHQGECRIDICGKCRSRDHMTKDCEAPDGRKCYECGSTDHLRNKCPDLGRDRNDARN